MAAAETLMQSRWLLESVVESSDGAVIGRRLDGLIGAWNPGAQRLYGYAAEEVLGRAYDVIVPRWQRKRERSIARRALRGEPSDRYESTRVCKDGGTIDVSVRISPTRDLAGTIVGVSTIEYPAGTNGNGNGDGNGNGNGNGNGPAWAAEIDSDLRSAFEHAPIATALVSLDPASGGRFLRVNRALAELTGFSIEELESRGLRAVLHPEDLEADRAAMARLTAGEVAGFAVEQRLLHAEDRVVWVIAHASLVRDASGLPLHCIRQLLDIEERKRFEGELGYLADHDPLTGLLNRRGFVRELAQQIAHASRYGAGGVVLFLDLDDFKYVNDTLGHSAGDEAICSVAHVVAGRLRETDIFARLGGDEFAVLLPHATLSDAQILAARLLEAVRHANVAILGEGHGSITVSIGATAFHEPSKDLTADDVLVDADLAMYSAKESGKDRVAVASVESQEHMKARVTWAERVGRAVKEGLFELHCQPILSLADDRVSQWELLLRLPTEGGELILPPQFLHTAERSGTILEIDRWVLTQAMRLIAEHAAAGRELRLEVNLSGRSVADARLPAFIEQELEASGIEPRRLVLEVTEAAAISNMAHALKFAARVADIGCGFALDDFGAGFGSFYYLKYIQFDFVKIDGEFIRHLATSSTDQLIVDSIVQMSRGLEKRTIAEFVGDDATVQALRERGVDFAQGNFLGSPRPVSEALAL